MHPFQPFHPLGLHIFVCCIGGCLVNHIVAVTEYCKFHSECVWSFLLSGQFESVHYCWTTREANASSDVIRNLSVGLPEPPPLRFYPSRNRTIATQLTFIYMSVTVEQTDIYIYIYTLDNLIALGNPFKVCFNSGFSGWDRGVLTSATCLCQTLATCQHPVIIKP